MKDNPNILVLTEGGRGIGFGHVTRCMAIGQAFAARGIRPKVAVNGDQSLVKMLKEKSYIFVDWLKKNNKAHALLEDADIVIIDSYKAGKTFYDRISESGKLGVYVDDFNRLDYPGGIIVNGSINAGNLKYPVKEDTRLLLGTVYAPIRKEFWNSAGKSVRKAVSCIMVIFGGNDPCGMTLKTMKLLVSRYPKLAKKVIIGAAFEERAVSAVEKLKDERTELFYHPGADKIKDIMLDADIAISAGGVTLYELASMGVPTVAVSVVGNQQNNVNGWEEAGFIKCAGSSKRYDVADRISSCIGRILNAKTRSRMRMIGRRHVDGKGARRIADAVMRIWEGG